MSTPRPAPSLVTGQLFRGSFEHSPVGMAIIDEHGILLEANPALARILGYGAPQELAGLRTASLTHPDDAPKDMAAIRAMLDGHQSYSAEKRYVRKDGSVCHARISSTLVRGDDKRPVLFFMHIQDVTEERLAERELKRLADAAELGSDAIVSIDLDNRIQHWNRGAERVFGFAADEVIGLSLDELDELTGETDQSRTTVRDAVGSVLSSKRGHVQETVRLRKDGTSRTLAVAASPWWVDGRVVGVTSTMTDLTDRKQAEQTTARLAAIVDGSDDAIIGKTLEGTITSWNPSAERIYGYRADEAVGQHISMLASPGNEGEFAQIMATVRGGAVVRHLETIRRRKDGHLIDASITVSPIRDGGGEIVGAATVARDISELKQAERAREQTLRNLAEAQRLARLGSWTWDSVSDQASWSAQMYEIFERDPTSGAATNDEFFQYVHPEDRERIVSGYVEGFGSGPGFELSYRILTPAGVERHLRGLGYQDPAHPGSYIGTVQDVTDQHRAEQERIALLEATVRAEAANRAKSEFLARMSHELRTPLNSIIGFSQLMELEGLDPRQQKHVSLVLRAARHLLELINDVLDIARIEAGRLSVSLEPVALAEAIGDALELVSPLAAERHISIDLDTSGIAEGAHVNADSNRLRQVLLNLLSNAIKYNRPAGSVHVTAVMTLAGRLRIGIADTGMGIIASELTKLFEPFERLGAEQTEIAGTGLGLSLSKALLEAMGGTIDVASQPGIGSTFFIELEVAEVAEHTDRGRGELLEHTDLRRLETPGERRRILYVEDNLSNLTLVEEILERYSGIELLSTMQGTLGLELARQQQPDLVILDLHLPDISGIEVLKRLKSDPRTRDIPVVMLTANPGRRESVRARSLGAGDYLAKPIDVIAFIDVIARHLAVPQRGS
jgi:PAS domain S-box-containing protein